MSRVSSNAQDKNLAHEISVYVQKKKQAANDAQLLMYVLKYFFAHVEKMKVQASNALKML
jgi:hypothetical protein